MNGDDLQKYYYNRRFKDLKELLEIRIESIEKAIMVAQKEMDRRLEGMNEFREQMNRQEATYYTTREMDIYKDKVNEDIRILRESKASLEGKADQKAVFITLIISCIGLLIAIIAIIVNFL